MEMRHEDSEVTAQHSLLASHFIQRVKREFCFFLNNRRRQTASHLPDRCSDTETDSQTGIGEENHGAD